MNNLKAVFSFGWPYLRRYKGRLLAGILFGILFGMANGSFIWATKTLVERMDPNPPAVVEKASKTKAAKFGGYFKERAHEFKLQVDRWVNLWLPMAGESLNWQQVLGGLFFLPLIALFLSTTDYLADYCMGWVSERVINDLRIDVLAKLNTLSLDYFNRSTIGDLITRIQVDTSNLHKALKDSCGNLVKGAFQCMAVLAALFIMDWKLTLFTLIFLPLCLFPIVVLGRKARQASRSMRKASVSQSSLLVELLSGIRVIKAFNLENHELTRFRAHARQLVHHGMKNVQVRGLTNPIIHFVSMLGLGMLIVYVFYTKQTTADMVGFLTALGLLFNPIKKIAGVHINVSQAGAGIERLIETLGERPTVCESISAKPVQHFQTQVSLECVSFSYGDKPVLRDISVKIPRGFKLGVVGESGSGKSTFVNLLFRFYDPTSGAIKIDGTNLREVSIVDLREQMALVSQEIVLFNESVAANIERGKLGANHAEIVEAAKNAFAHEFISQLPQGYNTIIGERGMTLSGGQRQRIAIARAFIRNAPILVLDEATASLDSQSEAEVQAGIERLEQNRTVVCVAHRLSTLAGMDQIIVLSGGQIVEQGGFEELLKKGGVFAEMARRQGIFSAV